MLSSNSERKNTYFEKGIREYLLCFECEQMLGKYEKYAKEQFFDKMDSIMKYEDKDRIVYAGLDYTKFKLFQLSILWRVSVSRLKYFQEVDLGPHEETIRQMILNGTPGEFYEYGFLSIEIAFQTGQKAKDLILSPEKVRADGFNTFRLTYGGIIWIFIVSSHNNKFPNKEFFLSESGTFIAIKKDVESIKFLKSFGLTLKQQGKI